MAVRMLRLGEETGQLPMLAGRVAEFYEAKLQRSLDRIVGIAGPAAIIVISIIVGGLIVSVMTSLRLRQPDRRLVSCVTRCNGWSASAGDRRAENAASTLVELLVVITIIALIMGIVGSACAQLSQRVEGEGCQDPDRELRERARSLFSRHRPLSERLGRLGRAGAPAGNITAWNGPLSKGRRRAA